MSYLNVLDGRILVEQEGRPSALEVAQGAYGLVLELGWSLDEFATWTRKRYGLSPLAAVYKAAEACLWDLAAELERRRAQKVGPSPTSTRGRGA